MSYTPHIYSPHPPPAPTYYSSTPPAPPPKTSNPPTPSRGPPRPPPPGQAQNEPSELEARQSYPSEQRARNSPSIAAIESGWLPEVLKETTTGDLHHFLSSTTLQAAILTNPQTTHPAIPAAESQLEPIITANLTLSDAVLERESRLRSLRERTQSRLLALRALEQQHRTKISETEDALRDFSPKALYQRLNASVQEQDQLLRGIEESWLDEDGVASDREVGDFVRRVKEAKKVAFLRHERKDRWDKGRVGGWR